MPDAARLSSINRSWVPARRCREPPPELPPPPLVETRTSSTGRFVRIEGSLDGKGKGSGSGGHSGSVGTSGDAVPLAQTAGLPMSRIANPHASSRPTLRPQRTTSRFTSYIPRCPKAFRRSDSPPCALPSPIQGP